MALQYFPRRAGYALVLGLAADTKPALNDSSVFFETDTGKWFSRESAAWVEKLAPGGGGDDKLTWLGL